MENHIENSEKTIEIDMKRIETQVISDDEEDMEDQSLEEILRCLSRRRRALNTRR